MDLLACPRKREPVEKRVYLVGIGVVGVEKKALLSNGADTKAPQRFVMPSGRMQWTSAHGHRKAVTL